MNQEAARDAAAADKDLNAVYKKVMAAQQDDEGKALLKAAQLAWLAYRDAEAKFSADEMRGGSAAPLLYSGAVTRLTKERIKVLKMHLGEEDAAEPEKKSAPPTEKPATKPAGKPQKVTFKSALQSAGSSKLVFTDEKGKKVEVSVMSKAQRTGMGPDEPYIKYPEKMLEIPEGSDAEANPAMLGKSFLLVKDAEGEVVEIKSAP